MLTIAPLGGFREDTIGVLSFVLGQQKATRFVTSLETHIQDQAKIGAERAIPRIKEEAQSAVRPYVIGSLIAAGVAVLVGGFAVYRSYRR